MGEVCSKSKTKDQRASQQRKSNQAEHFKFESFDLLISAKVLEEQFEVKYNRKKNELYKKTKQLAADIPTLRGSQDHQKVFDEMSEIIKLKNSCITLNKCAKYSKMVKERSKKITHELNNKNYQELYQFDKVFQGLFQAKKFYGEQQFVKFNNFIDHLDPYLIERWSSDDKVDHHLKSVFRQKQPDVLEVKEELDDFLQRFSLVLKDYKPNYQTNNKSDKTIQQEDFNTMQKFDNQIEKIIDDTNKIQKRQSYGHIQLTESENEFLKKQKKRKTSKKEEEITKKFTQNINTIKIDFDPIQEEELSSSSLSENLLDF